MTFCVLYSFGKLIIINYEFIDTTRNIAYNLIDEVSDYDTITLYY